MNPWRLFTKTEYAVAYRISENDILSDRNTPFSVLMPNAQYWFADPFVYLRDGKTYVFMEVMKVKEGYAAIGVSEWKDGRLTQPEIVLDTGRHLSFPFLFEKDGALYMMPESCSEGCVQLFRCMHFPDQWQREQIVLKQPYADSVIVHTADAAFLLTSKGTEDMYGSELLLFTLSSSSGLPQVNSPDGSDAVCVTRDYRFSRMGGEILLSDGKQYRVAQDCSGSDYGKALCIMEILSLSSNGLSEREAGYITPKDVRTIDKVRGKAGIHTYNRCESFEVIDFKLCTFSLRYTMMNFKIVLNMLFHKG